MATFYPTLGSKTLAELPKVPTNLVLVGSTNNNISATWTNNNTLTGTTNIIQVWNGTTWVDNKSEAASATTVTTTGITTAGFYNARVSVKKGSSYYSSFTKNAEILQDTLLAKWFFNSADDTDGAKRKSENGGTFQFVGGTAYDDPGQVGRCINSLGKIYLNNATFYSAFKNTNPWTISWWGRRGESSAGNTTISYNNQINFATNNLKYKLFSRMGDTITVTTDIFSDNIFHQYAMKYDGTTLTAYVNGVSKGTIASTSNCGDGGDFNLNLNNSYYFHCDSLYVYSKALSDAEVLNLYNNPEL